MRYVGLYKELGFGESGSMMTALRRGPNHNRARVADYLRNGTPHLPDDRLIRDPLNPARPVVGTAELLTDGEFAWPKALAHFVENHGIRVPEELERQMKRSGWAVSQPAATAPQHEPTIQAVAVSVRDLGERNL